MPNVCKFQIKVIADAAMASEIEGVLGTALEVLPRQSYYGHAILHLDQLDPSHPWEGQEWLGLDRDPGESCFIAVEGGLTLAGSSPWTPPLIFAAWLADRIGAEVECGGTTGHEYYELWHLAPGGKGRLIDAYSEDLLDDYRRWHVRDGQILDQKYTDDPEEERRLREAEQADVQALVPCELRVHLPPIEDGASWSRGEGLEDLQAIARLYSPATGLEQALIAGRDFDPNVHNEDAVAQLRREIAQRKGHPSQQFLLLAGRVREDTYEAAVLRLRFRSSWHGMALFPDILIWPLDRLLYTAGGLERDPEWRPRTVREYLHQIEADGVLLEEIRGLPVSPVEELATDDETFLRQLEADVED